MKDIRKTSLRFLVALVFVAACMAAVADAQNREERFISARAGGVNFVNGDVKVRRADAEDWQTLSVKDDLKNGDSVRAGASGRVEVLLNPGSYFRAGDGSEFVFADVSLDNLQLKLTRGSVVVEATGYDGLDLSIIISTPQTRVRIARGGVYRINVLASGETEVAVQSGRAFVGDSPGTLLKGGKIARVGASGAEVAKLDKKNSDALDKWSRERGHELAQANDALATRTNNTLLARTSFDSFYSAEYRYDPIGFWFWSARNGCYTFLPFSAGFRSPYGYWYGRWFVPFDSQPCSYCSRRNNAPIIGNANPNGGASQGTTGGYGGWPAPTTSPTTTGRTPPPQPPTTTIDRSERPAHGRSNESSARPLDQF